MTVAYITSERFGVDFEDRVNKLTRIDPEECPAWSMFGKLEAESSTHNFQSERLAPPNKDNAAVQGAAVSNTSGNFIAPDALVNYTQLFENPFAAATSHNAANKPGIGKGKMSTFNHEKAKKYVEMKRDGDQAILSNNAAVQPLPNSTVAGKLRGTENWIATNAINASTQANITKYGGSDLSQSMINDLAKRCFDQGGRPKHIFCNSAQKLRINEFVGRPTRDINSTGKTIVDVVDFIESICGKQEIVVDQYMEQSVVQMLELQYCKIAIYQAPDFRMKGIAGHADEGFTFMEFTIEVLAEKACGKITGLNY